MNETKTDVDERRKQRYAGGAFLVGVAGMSKLQPCKTKFNKNNLKNKIF